MKRLLILGLLLALPRAARAASYIEQASLDLGAARYAGLGVDALRDLYALALPAGATTYAVRAYRSHGLEPLFSFDTGVSSPAAFAVDPSGVVSVLDAREGIWLRRFTNSGFEVGRTSYSVGGPYSAPPPLMSAAIDAASQRVYLAYQEWTSFYCVQCLGCPCPPAGLRGSVLEYDFSGRLQRIIALPGVSATAGTCYTPTRLAVDGLGHLYVADSGCGRILKYDTATGALSGESDATAWTGTYTFEPTSMWTDPAGDLYVAARACGPLRCEPSVARLSSSGQLKTRLAAPPSAGCAWDGRLLYLGGEDGRLSRRVLNSAPSVPAQEAPLGAVVQHSSSAWLSWQASNDADGDPVAYSVLLGTRPAGLSPLGEAAQPALATEPLSFGATYYWQVSARDSYLGLPLETAAAPLASFSLALRNGAPGAFAVVSGSGTALTRAASAVLGWTAASDPDGDPVGYEVSWRPAGQAAVVLGTTSARSWPVEGLSFGSTYYWSVRATDAYGAASALSGGEQSYRPVFRNAPPAPLVYLTTAPVLAQHASVPSARLEWAPAAEPDEDPVSYRFELSGGTRTLASEQVSVSTWPALRFGVPYSWRVIASDPYGGASTGPWTSFTALLDNKPPFAPSYAASAAVATRESRWLLDWADAGDPEGDERVLRLYLGTSPASLSLAQEGGTSYSLPLAFGATVYWRVDAEDSFGARTAGPVASFLALFRNEAPPAPSAAAGAGALALHSLSPSARLEWTGVLDPDGDEVSYRLLVGTAPAALAPAAEGEELSWTLSTAYGTTYYWRASACDAYGACASSPTRSLVVELRNAAPTPPVALAGSGTLPTRDPRQTLSWSASRDDDGDALLYELSLSTDPGRLEPMPPSAATVLTRDFPLGATYYWRVTARDGFGGEAASEVHAFHPAFRNAAPAAPRSLTPAGTVAFHGSAPSLSFFWEESSDPDGDPFAYELRLGTDAAALPVLSSATLGRTAAGLSLDVPYWYRISAVDAYGAVSDSPAQWVFFQFANAAPASFDVLAGTGTVATRETAAALEWGPAGDPDGDLVGYRVYAGTSPAALALLADTPKPSAALPALLFGATHYWRVEAYDGYGATTPARGGVQALLPLFRNAPPAAAVVLTTAAAYDVHAASASVTLAWAPSQDADGDPVSYRLDIKVEGQESSLDLGSDRSATLSPVFGSTYSWRVVASDPYGGASTGSWRTLVARFVNRAPAPVVYASTSAVTTRARSFELAWRDSGDPDGDACAYELRLGTEPAALAPVLTGSATSYTLAFEYGTTYYWRVAAVDAFGARAEGELRTFRAEFLNDPPGELSLDASFIEAPVVATMRDAVEVSWRRVATPQEDPIVYTAYLGASPAALEPVARVEQTAGPAPRVSAAALAARPAARVQAEGDELRLRLEGLDFYRTYYLRVEAANPYGARSSTPVSRFTLSAVGGLPKAYNYPNPFSPASGTTLVLNAPPEGHARAVVSVYSEWGDLLYERAYDGIRPGVTQIRYDGRDARGAALHAGSYPCRVRFEGPAASETFYLLVVR